MEIITRNGDISVEEKQNYVDYLEQKYNRKVSKLILTIDGDSVDMEYYFESVPFQRIRRITGYLVGSTDKWNDAKRQEEKDRVKHDLPSTKLEKI